MPPLVGRVLEPSVAGISVAGDSGWSDITMPGVAGLPRKFTSPDGDGRGDAFRSGAMDVAFARPGTDGAISESCLVRSS